MAGIVEIDIGDIIEGASSLVNSIGNQIRGKVPVDMMKLDELEVKMAEIRNVIPNLLSKVDEAQAVTNTEDAKSKSFWQSGWRPAAAWICVGALFYTYIGMPLFYFLLSLFKVAVPDAPKLDMAELLTLLFGMLGLGTLRTVDKIKLIKGGK